MGAQKALNSRPQLSLALIGLISAAVYAAICGLSFRFDLEDPNNAARPILLVLSLFTVNFLLYFGGIWFANKASSSAESETQTSTEPRRWASPLVIIVAFGLLFRVLTVPSNPIQEIDIYRYILDGATVAAGFDPYVTPPQKIVDAMESSEVNTTWSLGLDSDSNRQQRLADSVQSRPGLKVALGHVHFKQYTTPYPPVSQAAFAGAMAMVPQDADAYDYLLAMKAMLVLFDLATAWLIILMLRHVGRSELFVIVYLWCPLLLKEVANGGHLDSIAVFFASLGVLGALYGFWPRDVASDYEALPDRIAESATESPEAKLPSTRDVRFGWVLLSMVSLAMGVAAKVFPIVLFPAWCMLCWKKTSFGKAFIGGLGLIVLTITMTWPMIRHLNMVNELGQTIAPAYFSNSQPRNDIGIEAFAKYWEMNDFLFMVAVENLKPDETVGVSGPAWFVATSNQFRNSTIDRFQPTSELPRNRVAFWVTQRVMMSVFFLVAVGLAILVFRNPSPEMFLRVVFLTLAWFWLLSPTQNPWYWTWAMPFLVFAKSRIWFLVAGAVMAYYLRFYFEYHFTGHDVLGTGLQGTAFFDFVIPWLEFGPILLALMLASLRSCCRKKTNSQH